MHFAAPLMVALLAFTPSSAFSELGGVNDTRRAHTNYMLNCQGCHGPDGGGTSDGAVPLMKGCVGSFLSVPGGREFLVQVPGSANSALDDASLAEVLNWMLHTMSEDSLKRSLIPYTALEVSRLRKAPIADVETVRSLLMQQIAGVELTQRLADSSRICDQWGATGLH